MVPALNTLPSDIRRQKILKILSRYEDKEFVRLSLGNDIVVRERLTPPSTYIESVLHIKHEDYKSFIPISSVGHGPVNALSKEIVSLLRSRYQFADRLNLLEFKIDTNHKRGAIKTNSNVTTTLIVSVDHREVLSFRATSHSILEASLSSVLQMFELYMNAEKSINKINMLLDSYRKRNRGDLYTTALLDLSNLVSCTCYKS